MRCSDQDHDKYPFPYKVIPYFTVYHPPSFCHLQVVLLSTLIAFSPLSCTHLSSESDATKPFRVTNPPPPSQPLHPRLQIFERLTESSSGKLHPSGVSGASGSLVPEAFILSYLSEFSFSHNNIIYYHNLISSQFLTYSHNYYIIISDLININVSRHHHHHHHPCHLNLDAAAATTHHQRRGSSAMSPTPKPHTAEMTTTTRTATTTNTVLCHNLGHHHFDARTNRAQDAYCIQP